MITKITLSPTQEQKETIKKSFGVSRFIYNTLLNKAKEEDKILSKDDCKQTIAALSQELEWIQEANEVIIAEAIKDFLYEQEKFGYRNLNFRKKNKVLKYKTTNFTLDYDSIELENTGKVKTVEYVFDAGYNIASVEQRNDGSFVAILFNVQPENKLFNRQKSNYILHEVRKDTELTIANYSKHLALLEKAQRELDNNQNGEKAQKINRQLARERHKLKQIKFTLMNRIHSVLRKHRGSDEVVALLKKDPVFSQLLTEEDFAELNKLDESHPTTVH